MWLGVGVWSSMFPPLLARVLQSWRLVAGLDWRNWVRQILLSLLPVLYLREPAQWKTREFFEMRDLGFAWQEEMA